MASIIEIIKNAPAIAEGTIRTVLNIRTDIMRYREENYCMKCPISHQKGVYTGVCDESKGGCGCKVSLRTSQNNIGCSKGFWANNWFKEDKFNEFLELNK